MFLIFSKPIRTSYGHYAVRLASMGSSPVDYAASFRIYASLYTQIDVLRGSSESHHTAENGG